MIIGFDGNEANVENRVGVSWYTYHLLHALARLQTKEDFQVRVFLKFAPKADLPKKNDRFQYVIVPKRTIWSQIDLPLNLFLKQRDLNAFVSPAHYAPRFCPVPSIVVLHDLSYYYFPEAFLKKDLYQLEKWTAYSVKNAAQVICVSEKTKQDALSIFYLPEKKLSVVYNGYSKENFPETKLPENIIKPYFLFVGTLQPRKNIRNLILAFAKFIKKHADYKLYLVGKQGWLFENVLELIRQYHLEKSVFFLNYITESEKQVLLKNAHALIMPGFYEGFGLPILEAFAAGTPVLVSEAGALPEIVGEAGLYFNPFSVTDLANKMAEMVQNKELRSKLVIKGKERLTSFSWDKTAQGVLNLINKSIHAFHS